MDTDVEPFRIYSASAGSGKTYTLTREYLKLLLGGRGGQPFREILAITFTNKAVGELKARILSSLESFSDREGDPSPLFLDVQEQLNTDPATLSRRAGQMLQEILHNYAFFDISTIDKFNHRILRTFARDLQLPANFEVVLDTDPLLERAVDNLVMQAGQAADLTRVLIDFALEKSAEDRSWDISRDLAETGKLLFDENHRDFLKTFRGKEMADFLRLREKLGSMQADCEARLVGISGAILREMERNGLETMDFRGGYFPKFITKINDGDFDQDFDAGWKQNFADAPLYTAKKPGALKDLLDELHPGFASQFNTIESLIYERAFLQNARTNLAPFTVLGLLQAELEKIQEADNLLPIARFNSIISAELADQPAPYIYERLGEKYRHYFIDEFQDTSQLQWENLVPLIGNALEGEDEQGRRGSLVLVGDAKQAIYRWRGGRAEQFLGLIDGGGNPFSVSPARSPLNTNYRSSQMVVDFNNDFFTTLSSKLNNPEYSRLFEEGTRQQVHSPRQGMVEIEFLDPETEDPRQAYLDHTVGILRRLREAGYDYGSVCILTRRRRDGVALSDRLLEENIPVISSETLLLCKHPPVAFLIDLLRFLTDPADRNHRFGILAYLAPAGGEAHSWISRHLEDPADLLLREWSFDTAEMSLKPAYDVLEHAIRRFGLAGDADAYLFALLEHTLEAGRQGDISLPAFLEYWELKRDTLSISAPESPDAVRIMTIHSAKGLEFPVVIFPFADSPIYAEKNPKLWVPVDPEVYSGFHYLQIQSKKEAEHYGPAAAACYRMEREKLELDAFNVLYVAHTRAIEALFVLTGPLPEEETDPPSRYTDLYRHFLGLRDRWDGQSRRFTFGSLHPSEVREEPASRDPLGFVYTARDGALINVVTRSGRLWDSPQEAAKKYGNAIHLALSRVRVAGDVPDVVAGLIGEGLLQDDGKQAFRESLEQIVEHPELSSYFKEGPEVYNERDIILRNKVLLRPDRLVVYPDRAVVIDYKTATPSPAHREQIAGYARAVEEMGMTLDRALLVYIKDNGIEIETL